MKEPDKKDSKKKEEKSTKILSAKGRKLDDNTEFDIPVPEEKARDDNTDFDIPVPQEKARDDNTEFDIPSPGKKQVPFGIPSAEEKKLKENTDSFNIPDAESAPKIPKKSLSIKPAAKSKDEKSSPDKEDQKSTTIDKSPLSDLNETSLDMNTSDIPGIKDKKTPESKNSMADTDANIDEEIDKLLSSSDEENLLKYSYHADEDEDEKSGHSIMDLLDTREITMKDIEDLEESADSEDSEVKLDDQISGKTLDEILKTSQKSEEDYHESKNESIASKKKLQTKHKKLKILLGVAILIIVVAAITMNIVKAKLRNPEQDQSINPVTFDRIDIPANLKDKKKLKTFLTMAENLYKSKKYKKSESILKKLLRTGWNKPYIYGIIGDCQYQQNNEQGAIDNYRKSIEGGYNDKIDFAMNLAKIYDKRKEYPEVISTLEPFKEKNASNQEMQTLLSTAYYKEGKIDETLECYKHMNTNMLPEAQLREYAELLEKKGNKKEAFTAYLTLGQIYSDTDAYLKAEKLAPDETTRISILARIVGKTANTPKGVYYKMLLGIRTFNSGNKKEGLQILKGVNTDRLNKRDATEFLKLLPHFEGEKYLLQEAQSILAKYYKDDLKMHMELKESLEKAGKDKFCENFFKKEYMTYPNNPIANFLYASFQSDPNLQAKLYKKAIKLSPDFFEAQLALGKFYINEQKWKEAPAVIIKSINLNPRSIEARYYYAIIKIHGDVKGKAYKYLQEYENFLSRIKLPQEEKIKQMLRLSQYMRDQQYALIYLKKAEKIKSLQEFYKREYIKTGLIYKTLKKSDFGRIKDPVIRKYYIIYLLGKGDFNEIIALPLKKEDFPDFWKTMILWQRDIPSWKKNADLFLEKGKGDLLMETAMKMWLRKIKPDQVEKLVTRIEYTDKPLLFILTAMQYKKNLNRSKSKNSFNKALHYPKPNIYVEVAEYLKNLK